MPKRLPHPGLMTYADVADALSASPSTVRRLVRKGLLEPPQEIEGVGTRFWEDDVLRYLALQRTKKPAIKDKPGS